MQKYPSGYITLRISEVLRNKRGVFCADFGGDNLKVLRELQSFGISAGLSDRVSFFFYDERAIILGKRLKITRIPLKVGERLKLGEIVNVLILNGWERVDFAEMLGQFAIRGGILDLVFENTSLRVELDGDVIYDIREFSPYTQVSISKHNGGFLIIPDKGGEYPEEISIPPKRISPNPPFLGDFRKAVDYAWELYEKGYKVLFFGNPIRIALFEGLRVDAKNGNIYEGFSDFEDKVLYLGEWEILGAEPTTSKIKISKVPIKTPRYLQLGDYIVHEDYGIGVFVGLEKRNGLEMMSIQYKDGKVYVPVYKSHKVSKYIGPEGYEPEISSIYSGTWNSEKKRALAEISEIAREIVNLIFERKTPRGFSYPPIDNEKEFWATFPYTETEDQIKAINDVLSDLEGPYVMDRLIVGEVSFGKTEVALRAAFRVLSHGKSVVWLCPSTLLAYQHYKNFKDRFEMFGIPVYMVSRLKKEFGDYGLFVGTHALLNQRINNLGLVVVDEEQHFGVLQKEKFKKLNPKVDYLYLSATPIPRTLGMGLEGLISISHIRTPPPGRLPIETYVEPWSEERVKNAIERELERDGQVFYVYNRIEGLKDIFERLRAILPGVPMEMLHGRMKKTDIKRIMDYFSENKIKVLVSTAIIEAGLDFRNANTLIIDSPEMLGISQLHQLRGRIGRWDKQAYAFLLYRNVKNHNAKRRLEYILMYSSLGDGYKLALKDLEIRGMGELLGIKQHGNVKKLGFKLYIKLIKRALGFRFEYDIDAEDAYIPEDYIRSTDKRVEYYIKLAEAESEGEIMEILNEMRDIFGEPPVEVENLIKYHTDRVKSLFNDHSLV
ncbi:MAG: helicase-related protein [candidate division WOR-3 bacterium]